MVLTVKRLSASLAGARGQTSTQAFDAGDFSQTDVITKLFAQ